MNQLTYEAFSKEIMVRMQECLGPERSLELHKFRKNNNTVLDGIVLSREQHSISPTFYMNEFYECYRKGSTVEEIVGSACPFYARDYEDGFLDMERFDSFAGMERQIAFKLINRQANRDLLQEIPYFEYLDLAIVFYCVCRNADGGLGSVTIKNELMQKWGVDKYDLYEAAVKNTKRIFGIEITSIRETIADMILSIEGKEAVSDDLKAKMVAGASEDSCRLPMYVLTNKNRVNGAVGILYKELQVFADQLGDDLYLIPSSVHEVLLVPASEDITKPQLQKILTDVNRNELDEPDILSDRIYYYSRSDKKITL